MYTLTVDGHDMAFDSEAEAFKAAAREFEVHGSRLEVCLKMQGRTYIGSAQMRHWWRMTKTGKYYPDIPYSGERVMNEASVGGIEASLQTIVEGYTYSVVTLKGSTILRSVPWPGDLLSAKKHAQDEYRTKLVPGATEVVVLDNDQTPAKVVFSYS